METPFEKPRAAYSHCGDGGSIIHNGDLRRSLAYRQRQHSLTRFTHPLHSNHFRSDSTYWSWEFLLYLVGSILHKTMFVSVHVASSTLSLQFSSDYIYDYEDALARRSYSDHQKSAGVNTWSPYDIKFPH